MFVKGKFINSLLWRCSTARELGSRLSLKGPTEVEASKSFLFTKGSLKVEIKNSCLMLFHTLIGSSDAKDLFIISCLKVERSLSKFVVSSKLVTRCSGMVKSWHINLH